MGSIARLTPWVLLLAVWGTLSWGQNPLAPAPKPAAENPLAKKPDSPFAGTFRGQGVVLQINNDHSGTLTFNGKTYPVTGTPDGTTFNGKFKVDADQFDFQLAPDGKAMKLTTGGASYALVQEPRSNPLAPANVDVPGQPVAPQVSPANPGPDTPVANDAPVGGVGISFAPNEDGDLIVAGIMPGSPAAKAKLRPGGVLVAVDGKDVDGLKPDQLRALIGGKPGTIVKLTIETPDEVQTVLLERADLSKLAPPPGPQRPPANDGRELAPMPGPMPGPGGIGPPPALPGGDAARNAAAPAWMKPGVRVSFWAGSATVASAGAVLVPDAKGRWVDKNGKHYAEADNFGAGGMGYQQITIANMVGDTVVADFKQYLFNPEAKAYTTTLVTGSVVSLQQGGDLWVPPQKLALMQPGQANGVTIVRGPYTLNNKTFNSVSIVTEQSNGASRYTYDSDTGILIAMGSSSVGAGYMTPGPFNQSGVAGGNTTLVQILYAGMRQTNLPWTGQRAPAELAQLRRVDFQGSYTSAVANAGQVTWPVAVRWDIGKVDEISMQLRQTYKIDYGNTGLPNEPQVVDRSGSTAALWIDPRTLGQLKQGQVIDEDPITQMRTVVAGVQNGNVIIAEQGQIETTAAAYNQQTGSIQAMSLEQQVGLGKTVVQVQRTR